MNVKNIFKRTAAVCVNFAIVTSLIQVSAYSESIYLHENDFEYSDVALWETANTEELTISENLYGNTTKFIEYKASSSSSRQSTVCNLPETTDSLVYVDMDIKLDAPRGGTSRSSVWALRDSGNNDIVTVSQLMYGETCTLNGAEVSLPVIKDEEMYSQPQYATATTGWMNVCSVLDFEAKKANVKMSEGISGEAGDIFDAKIDFAYANAEELSKIFYASNKGNGSFAADNIKIFETTVPEISVEPISIDLSEATEASTVIDVDNWVISSVQSDDETITAEFSENTITIEGSEPKSDKTVTVTLSHCDVPKLTYDTEVEVDIINSDVATVPTEIVISGGSEYVYQPYQGEENVSEPFCATVYDQFGNIMENEAVSWSFVKDFDGVSIDDNGVVKVTDSVVVGDINGLDLEIEAASKTNTDVKATTALHIRECKIVSSFDISGKSALKEGESAEYTVVNVLDQYNEPCDASFHDFNLSCDSELVSTEQIQVTVNETNNAELRIEPIEIVIKCGNISEKRTIYAYYNDVIYYEPCDSEMNDTDNERFETIEDEQCFVFPKAGTATNLILPQPIEFEAGSAVSISWKNAHKGGTVFAQNRYMDFIDTAYDTVFKRLSYVGTKIGYNSNKVNGEYVFEDDSALIADMAGDSEWFDCNVIIRTDSNGVSTAVTTVNGVTAEAVPVTGTDIAVIQYVTGSGVPDERIVGVKDIIIEYADISGVSVSGDREFAKISGWDVQRQYTASAFGTSGNVSFAFSLKEPKEGVELDASGLLTVKDSVEPGTITIVATRTDKAEEFAEYEVEIKDFANILSFKINAPAVVSSGDTIDCTVSDITDEYGDSIPVEYMPATFAVVSGGDIAAIESDSGILKINEESSGDIIISAELGNPDMKKQISTKIKAGQFFRKAEVKGLKEIDVNVSGIINADKTENYILTVISETKDKLTIKANGENVFSGYAANGEQLQAKAIVQPDDNGIIHIEFDGDADSIELSPDYKFDFGAEIAADGFIGVKGNELYDGEKGYGFTNEVTDGITAGNGVAGTNVTFGDETCGFDVALADGVYDFIFYLGTGGRRSVLVNGLYNAVEINQNGQGVLPDTGRSIFEAKNVTVSGGVARITTIGKNAADYELAGLEVRRVADNTQRERTIWVAGDSTVCNYSGIYRDDKDTETTGDGKNQTGWAQLLYRYVRDDIMVKNFAQSGAYAKTWYNKFFATVKQDSKPGDYFFIQFGINDVTYSSVTEMTEYLHKLIDESRELGIIPVLITPQTGGNGTFSNKIREIATERNVLLIDLRTLKADYTTTIDSDFWTERYISSGVHLSYQGAKKCCELVVNDILRQQTENITGLQNENFNGIILNEINTYSDSIILSGDNDYTTVDVTSVGYDMNISIDDELRIWTPHCKDGVSTVSIENTGAFARKITLVTVGYEQGVVKDIKINNVEVQRYSESSFMTDVNDDTITYRTFVWTSADEMIPLSN